MTDIEGRAQELLGGVLAPLPANARAAVLRGVIAFAEAEIARERARCRGLCLDRAELWEKTPAATHPSSATARDEARARANEARYLADLVE